MNIALGNNHGKLRKINPRDMYVKSTPKLMRSNVILPSQHQAYAVCVEFARNWFLSKYREGYFNSIYVDGSHSFDEFRKFSTLNKQMKRANPMLAIVPSIDLTYNRNWIDSTPEIPTLLRRSRYEGAFFHDVDNPKQLHLQIIFKTILMEFTYKIRLDTRAEQLDMMEFIKLNHRAGYTQTCNLDLDIHVPKEIITQIAWDNGFDIDDNGNPKDSMKMLSYLNSHSVIPFIYKLRCSSGNNEYFIKVPNCVAHIKAEMPSKDDGERQETLTTNYIVEFGIEIEMTAPYCYTYYSQAYQEYICSKPIKADSHIALMMAIKTEIPHKDEHGWDVLTTTEYVVDEEDLGTQVEIDFKEFFKDSDIGAIINYCRHIAINPSIFLNFKMFNDGIPRDYCIDWSTLKCKLCDPVSNLTTVIAIYCDLKFVNETKIQLEDLQNRSSRV